MERKAYSMYYDGEWQGSWPCQSMAMEHIAKQMYIMDDYPDVPKGRWSILVHDMAKGIQSKIHLEPVALCRINGIEILS